MKFSLFLYGLTAFIISRSSMPTAGLWIAYMFLLLLGIRVLRVKNPMPSLARIVHHDDLWHLDDADGSRHTFNRLKLILDTGIFMLIRLGYHDGLPDDALRQKWKSSPVREKNMVLFHDQIEPELLKHIRIFSK